MTFDAEVFGYSTGGILATIYNFMLGDSINIIIGILIGLSVLVLNIVKILKVIEEKKQLKNSNSEKEKNP